MQGYDENFINLNSPLLRGTFVPGMDFDTAYEVQARKINASKVNLGELVKSAGGVSAVGTLNTSPALNLSSSITYNKPWQGIKTFGHPQITIYQGTASSANQIYPARGANVTLGRYVVQGNFDHRSYNGTSDIWKGLLVDTNGTSAQEITFEADWLYIDYVTQGIQ